MVSRVLIPLTLLAMWQLVVGAGLVHFDFVPTPVSIAESLFGIVAAGELFPEVAHTLGATVLAAAIGAGAGGILGVALGLAAGLRRSVMASVDFLRSVPMVALIPVAVLAIGPVFSAEVAIGALAAFWPATISTAAGARALSSSLRDVGATLQLTPWARFRKIIVPAVAPAWLVGARISVVVALHLVMTTELITNSYGLGGRIMQAMNGLAIDRMWAYALVVGLIGYGLNALLRVWIPGSASLASGLTAPMWGLLPLVVVLVVWQLIGNPSSLTAPPPSTWIAGLKEVEAAGELWPAIGHTLINASLGMSAALLAGVMLGVSIGLSATADRMLSPTIDFFASIPGAALVPVFVLAFGTDRLSGVIVVALIASRPILLSTANAIRSVPSVRFDTARTLGLTTMQRWRKVTLPSALPGIMVGIRIVVPKALVLSLLFDILGSGKGLGRLLIISQQRFDGPIVWGIVAILGLLGYCASLAVGGLRRGQGGP